MKKPKIGRPNLGKPRQPVRYRIDPEDDAYLKSVADHLRIQHTEVRSCAIRLGVQAMQVFDGMPANLEEVIRREAQKLNEKRKKK